MNDYILGFDIPYGKASQDEIPKDSVSDLTGKIGYKTLYIEYYDPNNLDITTFSLNKTKAKRFLTIKSVSDARNKINKSEAYAIWKNVRGIDGNLSIKTVKPYFALSSNIKI